MIDANNRTENRIWRYAMNYGDGVLKGGLVEANGALNALEQVVQRHGGAERVFHAVLFNPDANIEKPIMMQFSSLQAEIAYAAAERPYHWDEKRKVLHVGSEEIHNLAANYSSL